ncbi:MAG TPA: hypothetical protein VE545_07020 [Candidatus Dormibacteraeota bacterium]|nr:hypothetical protein [Candidatus Dormibacteraeota bacterium]
MNILHALHARISIKQIFALAVAVMGAFAAACGGGSNVVPPPPTGGFSAASLNGTYAFSLTGEDAIGFPIFRIGSFQADGNGNITGAIEDVNDGGSISAFEFTPAPTSVYTVDANGKGTLTLVHPDPNVAGVNDTFVFTLTLTSTGGGLMIETDGSSTMSGNFRRQSITTNFAQAYAFDVSGLDLNLNSSESIIGNFTTNGSSITGGSLDDNDDASPSGQTAITPGTITFDLATGAQFGRGSLTLNSTIAGQIFNLTFEFYVIDGSHIQLIETDALKATVGVATAQSNVPINTGQIPGSFVFATGGGAFNSGNFGPLTRVGRYTADGNGALTNVALDQNFSGGPQAFPSGSSSITAGAVTIDPAGSGRGTVTFTDSRSGFQFLYIFYLANATQGFIQDNSVNSVSDGSLTAQTATGLSQSSIAGNYAFNWSGSNANGAGGNEEDFVGVFTLPSSGGALTNGVVDFAELGAGKVFLNVAFNGTFTLNGDGTGGGANGNTLQIVTEQTVSGQFNFRVYATSPGNFIIVGVDNGRVVIGPLILQQTPQ